MPGPPQARLGDLHTCTVPPSFPSPIMAIPKGPPVLVNNLVAAKVTDPTMSGPVPPVPPIPHIMIKGSFTVMINKMPAVRVGDLCLLGGPVALGSFNVFTGG
jgi:uncharacterized Zn-binding protein involved in type VI secretion